MDARSSGVLLPWIQARIYQHREDVHIVASLITFTFHALRQGTKKAVTIMIDFVIIILGKHLPTVIKV
ncbi:hypothetical protein N7508_001978 [Penicillium antarcticum]|uniref:uncharacterized protein n=1 Tax=Penicillium antarcticum TaxID=416450 RepID=UPI00239CD1CF|nr:uncharacterized protein N7508_001978 [Penicillium antarcticum]KAJ5317470.1 hypothetical protein N7508_001978 [Penicillium antarcticum]